MRQLVTLLLVAVARGEDGLQIDIASVAKKAESALQGYAKGNEADYFFADKSSYLYDPDGQLFKELYEREYRDQDLVRRASPIPLKMPQYPGYGMYHPQHNYSPEEKPILPFYPCCHYSPPQEQLDMKYHPAGRSPEQNCLMLVSGFLKDIKEEHNFHGCSYGNAKGGPVSPYSNYGSYTYGYGESGAVMVGKGSCVNVFFNPTPGTELFTPKVNKDGSCTTEGDSHRRPNMQHYENAFQRVMAAGDRSVESHNSEYGVQHAYASPEYRSFYQDAHQSGHSVVQHGYDYLLECSCLCEKPDHGATGHTYERSRIGY